jgi:hypothetical protein
MHRPRELTFFGARREVRGLSRAGLGKREDQRGEDWRFHDEQGGPGLIAEGGGSNAGIDLRQGKEVSKH